MGTWLPLLFTCTDPNAGDTITYTIKSSSEPTYFKVMSLPRTHLEVNTYISYDDPTTPAYVTLGKSVTLEGKVKIKQYYGYAMTNDTTDLLKRSTFNLFNYFLTTLRGFYRFII